MWKAWLKAKPHWLEHWTQNRTTLWRLERLHSKGSLLDQKCFSKDKNIAITRSVTFQLVWNFDEALVPQATKTYELAPIYFLPRKYSTEKHIITIKSCAKRLNFWSIISTGWGKYRMNWFTRLTTFCISLIPWGWPADGEWRNETTCQGCLLPCHLIISSVALLLCAWL